MPLLNDSFHVGWGSKAVAKNRFQTTPAASGGLGVAGVIVPPAGQVYDLTLRLWSDNATQAATGQALLEALTGGGTFTWRNDDPVDGHTYSCRLKEEADVQPTHETPGYWEWELVARGVRT